MYSEQYVRSVQRLCDRMGPYIHSVIHNSRRAAARRVCLHTHTLSLFHSALKKAWENNEFCKVSRKRCNEEQVLILAKANSPSNLISLVQKLEQIKTMAIKCRPRLDQA